MGRRRICLPRPEARGESALTLTHPRLSAREKARSACWCSPASRSITPMFTHAGPWESAASLVKIAAASSLSSGAPPFPSASHTAKLFAAIRDARCSGCGSASSSVLSKAAAAAPWRASKAHASPRSASCNAQRMSTDGASPGWAPLPLLPVRATLLPERSRGDRAIASGQLGVPLTGCCATPAPPHGTSFAAACAPSPPQNRARGPAREGQGRARRRAAPGARALWRARCSRARGRSHRDVASRRLASSVCIRTNLGFVRVLLFTHGRLIWPNHVEKAMGKSNRST